jgi:hypothetical protein
MTTPLPITRRVIALALCLSSAACVLTSPDGGGRNRNPETCASDRDANAKSAGADLTVITPKCSFTIKSRAEWLSYQSTVLLPVGKRPPATRRVRSSIRAHARPTIAIAHRSCEVEDLADPLSGQAVLESAALERAVGETLAAKWQPTATPLSSRVGRRQPACRNSDSLPTRASPRSARGRAG